jgi:endonuclease/exonuclease/phosphatase (EEP) superfamily protein YafD
LVVDRRPSITAAGRLAVKFARVSRGWCDLQAIAVVLLPVLLAGCISITVEPRALLQRDDGSIEVQSLACGRAAATMVRRSGVASVNGLDPAVIRILTWNIHKQEEDGWRHDLSTLIENNDILLLQEIVLDEPLQQVMAEAGLRWVVASSFLYSNLDMGVLTASRTAPIATCTQRVVEPLLRLPKSAVVTWFPLRNRTITLAVVNVHAINFSVSLGGYRAQFDALADALAGHEGPIILAGDLNTWTDARKAVVARTAARLRLTEVSFEEDRRQSFLGHQLDHIYTRALDVVRSSSIPVTSSDHNPVTATLRVAP